MSVTIAGIGTGVGKTVVSAVFVTAFDADYWKPIQAGSLNLTDSDTVKALASKGSVDSKSSAVVYQERHLLVEAISPHAAAAAEATKISLADFDPTPQDSPLVVELAGGLMVPLNQSELNIDLAAQLGFPVVLVANFYLGSINHTLLSVAAIKHSGLQLAGIVFNGRTNPSSREVIVSYTGCDVLADIPWVEALTPEFVEAHARQLRQHPRLAFLRP